MYKRLLIILVILVAVLIVVICFRFGRADNSAVNGSTGGNVSAADTNTSTAPDTESPASTPMSETEQAESPNESSHYTDIGSKLEKDELGYIFKNSLSADDIVSQLGKPEDKSDTAVYKSDGLEHQDWYYKSKGIEMNIVRGTDGSRSVFSLELYSPCALRTSRDIGIGSTKDDVLKAYKEDINPEDSSNDNKCVVAGSIYDGVIFYFENGLVSLIFVGAAAE